MSEVPLKQLPQLVWELKEADKAFCKSIIKRADKLWIHFSKNSAIIRETDDADLNILFVASMKNVKIKGLSRKKKALILSEPILYQGLSFDRIDISQWSKFQNHMIKQNERIPKHLNLSGWNVVDLGINDSDYWKMLAK
jgi:hypothetical protein